MLNIKQSTSLADTFQAIDSNGDPVTGKVDGDWTKRISKNGGAFAAMTVTITEMENGWYSYTIGTGHSDTLGILSLTFKATGVKQWNAKYRVEARLVDDVATPSNVSAVTSAISALLPSALDASGFIKAQVKGLDAAVITAASIASAAFAAAKFATGALANGVFGAGAIDAAVLASDTIAAAKIASGAVTSAKFAAGAIDATAIASDAITAAKIADGAIDAGAIAAGAITSAKFAAGAIDAAAIATDAFDADALKADAAAEIAAAVAAPSAATIAAAVAAPSAATIAAAVAAPSAATIVAAVLAGVVDGSGPTAATVKGVLARTDAAWRRRWTGLRGSTVTAYLADNVTKAFQFAQNISAGTRDTATSVNGD